MSLRSLFRQVRELRSWPYTLAVEDGFVVCRGCGSSAPADGGPWAGWTAFPDAGGEPVSLCPACGRREFGRFAMFLLSGRGLSMTAWNVLPAGAIVLAAWQWSGSLGPLAAYLGGPIFGCIVLGLLAGLVAYPLLKLARIANVWYLGRQVLAWRRRTAG